ncbi:MAG: protein of uncharacterized function [Microbacteriaceae bacterium]|nr:protein of uncharacterized function [Microbacteriaceae bacterium]
MTTYALEDVFKLSGVPTVTFVPPTEFSRLKVALRTPGRGVVVEGPSKIGKTSAVTRGLESISAELEGSALRLSARKVDDVELIRELPTMKNIGVVIIDDFHRLDESTRRSISDFMKILADEERVDSKVVVIGINQAGQSLLSLAPDLGGRIEVIKLGINPDDRVRKLVEQGSSALNIEIAAVDAIVVASGGSFNIAQVLCHDACLSAEVTETVTERTVVSASFELVRERVLDRLAGTFESAAETFARGKRIKRAGRAPYLQILRWLAMSEEWTVSLDREMTRHPELRGSVGQVVDKGHLRNHLDERVDELGTLLHYDDRNRVLAVEDPQFFFFIKNLAWNRFAERVGFLGVNFSSRYDIALSFAGAERDIAQMLNDALSDEELNVFFDTSEQDRILAENVEEYLAPIYKSEASFVVAILGPDYPDRIWTRFESVQFGQRFGEKAVIPVWFKGQTYGAFDSSRAVGGFTLDKAFPLEPQIAELAGLLILKVQQLRLILPDNDPDLDEDEDDGGEDAPLLE